MVATFAQEVGIIVVSFDSFPCGCAARGYPKVVTFAQEAGRFIPKITEYGIRLISTIASGISETQSEGGNPLEFLPACFVGAETSFA